MTDVVGSRTRLSIGVARTLIEGCALVPGALLGGTLGLGTALFALTIGPAVQLSSGSSVWTQRERHAELDRCDLRALNGVWRWCPVDVKRILIVANQTAAGSHLKAEVRKRLEAGPCTFTLLVPATPPREHAVWTDEEAYELAGKRLGVAMEGLKGLGAEIRGVVGDPSPMEAIGDELIATRYDEIILSTLPPGVSRWMKQDLPHRVERRFNVPVTHLSSEPAAIT